MLHPRTMTITRDVAGKLRQKHPYYSREWLRSYKRRTAVERSFGAFKDKSRLDLARDSIRLMGNSTQRLMRTLARMVAN